MLLREIKPRAYNALSSYEMLDPQARKRIVKLRAYYKQLEAAELTLKGLAEETGGAMWNPGSREELTALSPYLTTEIGTEYLFAYSTERQPDDNKFHAINVYATVPGLQIRSRRGIYANSIAKREAAMSAPSLIDLAAVTPARTIKSAHKEYSSNPVGLRSRKALPTKS